MANTPNATVRLDRDLVDAVRTRHGLAGASVSAVLRYALAVAAGRGDAATVAHVPIGRPRRRVAA